MNSLGNSPPEYEMFVVSMIFRKTLECRVITFCYNIKLSKIVCTNICYCLHMYSSNDTFEVDKAAWPIYTRCQSMERKITQYL